MKAKRIVSRFWVGGRGYVYDEAYVLEDGTLLTEEQYRELLAKRNRRAARDLHIHLGRLGIRDHYGFASRVLGRPVKHLSELTPDERNCVREEAYAISNTNTINYERHDFGSVTSGT